MYHNSSFECGVCGEQVPANAVVCPSCGADENTGLREDTRETDPLSELGLFDEEAYDYDEFLEREFGEDRKGDRRSHLHPIWIFGGIIALIAMVYWATK